MNVSGLVCWLGLAVVSAPNVDELITQLDNKEYNVRENAVQELTKLVLREKEPTVYNRMEELKKAGTLEQKWRAANVVATYYKVVEDVKPIYIWSLPDRFRFVNGEDIALIYYERAKNGIMVDGYNHTATMKSATRLYFLDQLKMRKISPLELIGVAEEMYVNYTVEQEIIYNFPAYFPYWPYHTIKEIPLPVDKRIRDLIERADFIKDVNDPPQILVDGQYLNKPEW